MREFLLQNRREIVNVLMTIAAAGIALLLATVAPKLGRRTFHRFERWCGRLARKPSCAVLFIAGAAFLLFICTIALTGIPQPRIHDEFSYLLAGETFAHGRLTNPPIPDALGPYFETMHELVRPTFASKYFPAQGMTLALGKVLTGYPIVGVVLSTTAACAALVWALLGWVRPRRWAVIGALVIVVHPIVIEWTTTYWGGNVAMLGGALVFGAIGRLRRSFTIFNSVVLALGLAILFNSRPYEGAMWSIAAGATLIGRLWRPGFVTQLLLPASAVLALTAAWIGYYDYRVTGDPLLLPDQLHTRQYMAVPRFYWSAPEPPKTYRNDAMRDHYNRYERDYFETQQTLRGWVTWFLGEKLYKFVKFYLLRSLLLTVGLIALPFALRSDNWIPFAYAVLFVIGWAIIPWFEAHYVGALLPVITMLALQGARWISVWRWRCVGRAFVRWCVVSSLLVLPFAIKRAYAQNHSGWWVQRTGLEKSLVFTGGKHLIIVRYGPDHISGNEWVFNHADMMSAPVIWARELPDMSPLLARFRDRQIWLLELKQDDNEPKLVPYSTNPQ